MYTREQVAAWSDPDLERDIDLAQRIGPRRNATEFVMAGLAHAYCDNLLTDKWRAFEIECLAERLKLKRETDEMHLPQPEGDFEIAPAGSHVGYCYRVIDLGTQMDSWQGQERPRRKLLIQWELSDAIMSDGRPFMVAQRYTFSSSNKGRLRKDLETWRGRAFNESDFGPNGFQIQNVLGHPAFLGLIHHTADSGTTYCNVTAVMQAPRGLPAYQVQNEQLFLSLEPGEFNPAVLEKLSDGLKATVSRSPEYHEITHRTQPAHVQPAAQPIQNPDHPYAPPGNGFAPAQTQPAQQQAPAARPVGGMGAQDPGTFGQPAQGTPVSPAADLDDEIPF